MLYNISNLLMIDSMPFSKHALRHRTYTEQEASIRGSGNFPGLADEDLHEFLRLSESSDKAQSSDLRTFLHGSDQTQSIRNELKERQRKRNGG